MHSQKELSSYSPPLQRIQPATVLVWPALAVVFVPAVAAVVVEAVFVVVPAVATAGWHKMVSLAHMVWLAEEVQ